MVAQRLAPTAARTVTTPIERCADGGVVVDGTIVLSAWRKPFTVESTAFLAEHVARAARSAGPLVSFAVYRVPSMREPPGADVREKMVELGNAYPFHHVVNVLDCSGFANAMSRLFLAGVIALMRRRDIVSVADSVENGLAISQRAGVDLTQWRPALDALLRDTFEP
jgi:hypothetical protein